MRGFEASSVIKAEPAAVWAVLTDGANWTSWDSAVVRLDGTIAPGEKVTVSVAGKKLETGTLAQSDSVDASATGVYPVEVAVTKDTWGPDVKALISKGVLPYGVAGELTGGGGAL